MFQLFRKTRRKLFGPMRPDRRVAVLPLEGVITEGRVMGPTGASVLDFLRQIVDQEIQVLVLRINSPGGTVGASQELYATLRDLSEQHGIKIVASMADVAASGGVYVAMAADYILAQPGTITGSIGVIIRAGNLRRLLDKIGVDSDVVKSGRFKDILSVERALSDEERALLQTTIDDTYAQFVGVVAARRQQSVETVKTYADGRIFSGQQALDLGLVDALGGFNQAVNKARELAGIPAQPPPRWVRHEKKKPLLQKLTQGTAQWGVTQQLFQWLEQDQALSGQPLWLSPCLGTRL
jgi:protease-4